MCQDGTEIQAFVAESQNQVVGVAIIRVEEVGQLGRFGRTLTLSWFWSS